MIVVVKGAEEKLKKRTVSQKRKLTKVKLAVVAKECRRVQRQLNKCISHCQIIKTTSSLEIGATLELARKGRRYGYSVFKLIG